MLIFISSFILLISWLSLILTELRIYNIYYVLFPSLFLISLVIILRFKKDRENFLNINKRDLIVLGFIILYSLFNSIYSHETFFGGRDDGVYSNSAIYLAKHGSLLIGNSFKNTNIVGYHNFIPNYFQPEFNFSYISWLALSYSLLGINGIMWSNFIPTILSLASIYYLTKEIANQKIAFLTLILISSSYLMFWFTRRTLTEIFSMFLVWFGILCFVRGYKLKNTVYLIISLLSFGLFMQTRFEGIFVYLVIIFLLLFLNFKKYISYNFRTVSVTLLIICHFIMYSLYIQPNYNKDYLTAVNQLITSPFNKYILNKKEKPIPLNVRLKGLDQLEPGSYVLPELIGLNMRAYMVRVLNQYNVFIYVLLLPISIIFLFKKDGTKFVTLIPLLINLPVFILLNDPNNSPDLPWFIRRFLPQIFPVSVLYFSIFLLSLKSYKFSYTIITLLVILNLYLSSGIIFFKDNQNLLQQTQLVSSFFSDNDVILVDGGTIPTFQYPILADPLYFIYNKNIILIREGWAITGTVKNGGIYNKFDLSKKNYLVTNSSSTWFKPYFKNYTLEPVKTVDIKYSYLKNEMINHLNDYLTVDIGPYESSTNNTQIIIYKIK